MWIQKQNSIKESIIFEILYMAPDFDSSQLDFVDQIGNLDKYLHSDSRPAKCVGKIMY